MLSGLQFWRLGEAGPDGLDVHCGQDGLFLAGTPLIERHSADYRIRPPDEIERLLSCAYGAEFESGPIVRGLARVAAALAVQLRLPALSGPLARVTLKAEDLRLACERLDRALNRAGWDPAKHPRAGVPPNPGWFAPTDGIVAQNEEEPRPEEAADPLAAMRRQLWQSHLATLREIDPANPQLFVLTAPGWAPRPEDLDALDSAIRTATIRRVLDRVRPGGVPIGTAGKGRGVRELPGGLAAVRALFNYLGWRTGY